MKIQKMEKKLKKIFRFFQILYIDILKPSIRVFLLEVLKNIIFEAKICLEEKKIQKKQIKNLEKLEKKND